MIGFERRFHDEVTDRNLERLENQPRMGGTNTYVIPSYELAKLLVRLNLKKKAAPRDPIQ